MTAEQEKIDLTLYEKEVRKEGFQIIAGIDEAGRGPLAGPVVAAACILPEEFKIQGINDSKKLTPKIRETLYEQIIADAEVTYGVGIVNHQEIDQINVYQATIVAMLQAVDHLEIEPDILLVDGMSLTTSVPSRKIIKGDSKVLAIAAASIIAKVTRDRIMMGYHQKWPEYGFNSHKGYPTKKHIEAIQANGHCPIHRLSFAPLKELQYQ